MKLKQIENDKSKLLSAEKKDTEMQSERIEQIKTSFSQFLSIEKHVSQHTEIEILQNLYAEK